MQITTYSPKQFKELESSWRLLEKGSEMTVFQSFDWFKNINELFFRENIKKIARKWVYYLVSDENNNPLMIAPIEIVKIGLQYRAIGLARGAYFIGRQGYTDYLNFIYDAFNEDVMDLILKTIQKKFHIKKFCFEQLLTETSLYKYIINNYSYSESNCYCARIDFA